MAWTRESGAFLNNGSCLCGLTDVRNVLEVVGVADKVQDSSGALFKAQISQRVNELGPHPAQVAFFVSHSLSDSY